jgi:transposase-like protein
MSRHRSKVPSDLPPAVKERLRKAYVESDVPVRDIDRRFGVDTRRLAEIARREGWPMRKKAREQEGAR